MNQEVFNDDPELYRLLTAEETRQRETLNLIASENFAPASIRAVGASVLTNKYTEGYPGQRYYGGCQVFDQIEELARERACQLFGAQYANVQPHSGASANNALFQALLRPGDRILGLALDHGGHLTHGMALNSSGILYRPSFYHLDRKTLRIDIDEVRKVAEKERPKLIIAGWSAYTDTLPFAEFRQIADDIEAWLLVDMAHFAGLVAGGAYPDPMPHAHFVTSTTHKTLRGPRGGLILSNSTKYAKEIDRAVFPGQQGGALGPAIAAKALAFHLASLPEWRQYALDVIENASALSESLAAQGQRVICAGKTHLLLVDLLGGSGKQAERRLENNNIVCNRNTIPFETRSPRDPSGLRLGSPALTTRGFKAQEMETVGQLVADALAGKNVKDEVSDLLRSFPV